MMDAELYERVRKLEKQVTALMERHPEVRAVLDRGAASLPGSISVSPDPKLHYADNELRLTSLSMNHDGTVELTVSGPFSSSTRERIDNDFLTRSLVLFKCYVANELKWTGYALIKRYGYITGCGYIWDDIELTLKTHDDWKPLFQMFASDAP